MSHSSQSSQSSDNLTLDQIMGNIFGRLEHLWTFQTARSHRQAFRRLLRHTIVLELGDDAASIATNSTLPNDRLAVRVADRFLELYADWIWRDRYDHLSQDGGEEYRRNIQTLIVTYIMNLFQQRNPGQRLTERHFNVVMDSLQHEDGQVDANNEADLELIRRMCRNKSKSEPDFALVVQSSLPSESSARQSTSTRTSNGYPADCEALNDVQETRADESTLPSVLAPMRRTMSEPALTLRAPRWDQDDPTTTQPPDDTPIDEPTELLGELGNLTLDDLVKPEASSMNQNSTTQNPMTPENFGLWDGQDSNEELDLDDDDDEGDESDEGDEGVDDAKGENRESESSGEDTGSSHSSDYFHIRCELCEPPGWFYGLPALALHQEKEHK